MIVIYITFFLFIICNPNQTFAEHPLKNRISSLIKGAYILYASSSYSTSWAAKNLIDGRKKSGWRSQKNSPFPHIITLELAGNSKIDLLKFSNETQEKKHPGISTEEIQVEFSTISSDSGYINVGTFTLKRGAKLQEFSIQQTKAHWIRLFIRSNYGHPHYTELMEFEAWGVFEFDILQIIFNIIWILGAALILANFSYHEFFIHLQKTKRTEAFKRNSFKKPFLLGLILIAVGISTSSQQPWLAATFGAVAFFLIIWYGKLVKFQAAKKQEGRD